jgi:hypothetical protein
MTPEQLETVLEAAARGELFAYFGYGSLVNRDTHRTDTFGAVRASVRGWRRYWQGRSRPVGIPISFLSVKAETDPEHELPGLLVFDRVENLPALDEREGNYDRRTVDPERIAVSNDLAVDVPIYIYEGKREHTSGTGHAILQSYLDAVLQGYLYEYGVEAVRRFVADTHAFDDTPVIRDRHAPRYPRHVTLTREESRLFDDALDAHGVTYRDPA